MDLNHLAWPFFDSACVEFATNFDRWACAELDPFEQNEGGDGVAARQIFELLAAAAGYERLSRQKPPGSGTRLVCAK